MILKINNYIDICTMERYELDKEYEFEFVGKDTRTYYDGTHYFYVKDDEKQYRVKAYDYQWDYDAIPSVLLCKVKHLNPICIEQSKSFILRDRYPFPKESVFEIREIRHDNKTQALYYVLKDAYGIYHRYYPKADEPYKPGDNIKLWVNGIKQDTGGAVHLELSSIGNIDNRRDISFREYSKWLEPSNESGYPPILICREGEGQYVEFKSCLSIPAGSLEPDIDKQSEIIVKVIAGFLNADGGTLYIGLDDNGYLREGIAADYPYLSKSNKLHYSYKENDDSYIRFITDRVRNWLGTTAQSYVHAQINCEKGRKYCIIKVDRSPIPIWFMHRALYERMGQNISHHVDNDITFYILKRFGYIDVLANLAKISRVEDPSMPQSHESSVEDEISPSSEVESKDIETITAIDATFGLFDKEKSVSYGSIYFLSGGRFVVSDKKSPIKDFIYKAELPQKARQMRSHDFVICYDNGDTDIVDLSQAIFNKSGDIIDTRVYEKGWNSSKVIKAAFSVLNNNQNRDIVAYVYRNNGVVYLKCCELSCLAKNPHKQFGNSGNQVLPNDSTLIYSMRIPGSSSVKHLLNTKALLFDSPADRNKFGIQISDIEGRFKLSLSKVLEAVVDDITLSTMPQPSITEADNSGEPTKSETLPSKAEDMPVVEDGKSNDSELNSEQGIQDFGRYN